MRESDRARELRLCDAHRAQRPAAFDDEARHDRNAHTGSPYPR